MGPDISRFLVSIDCRTYNQKAFIRDTLNGFLSQQTVFPFLAVIIDDASTDGEQDVIRNYVLEHFTGSSIIEEWEDNEAKWLFARHSVNTNVCFLAILLNKNLFGNPRKDEIIGPWEQTEYVAMCEGDDFWIDPLKLQKQVDFLKHSPDYAMCFSNCWALSNNQKSKGNTFIWDTYTTEEMILHNSLDIWRRGDKIVSPGHTSTILYRNPTNGLPNWIGKCFIGDEPLFIALSQFGKAKFLNEPMSVYRMNVGISSKDFSFERDYLNRIKMYCIIDEGLNKQYHRLILTKVISRYYKRLTRLAFRQKDLRRFIKFFAGYIKSTLVI